MNLSLSTSWMCTNAASLPSCRICSLLTPRPFKASGICSCCSQMSSDLGLGKHEHATQVVHCTLQERDQIATAGATANDRKLGKQQRKRKREAAAAAAAAVAAAMPPDGAGSPAGLAALPVPGAVVHLLESLPHLLSRPFCGNRGRNGASAHRLASQHRLCTDAQL